LHPGTVRIPHAANAPFGSIEFNRCVLAKAGLASTASNLPLVRDSAVTLSLHDAAIPKSADFGNVTGTARMRGLIAPTP
jgi:hypothetical protein